MDSDALAGAAVGLLGIAVLANVAGKVLKHPVKLKKLTKLKKIKW